MLLLHLQKAEMRFKFILHMVHVAGTQMIQQGTLGLLQESFLEGVAVGQDVLAFVNLALSATLQHPPILEFIKSWLEPASSGAAQVLQESQWFVEGHGIIGGRKDPHGVWLPVHVANGKSYIWDHQS